MKIGVLADTHIPITQNDLPQAVYKGLEGVDMIMHAGDLVELSVIDKLSAIAPVRAVYGNMDNDVVRSRLPSKDIIKAGGLSIGLIHGWGHPNDLAGLIKSEFAHIKIDAIVFGHSHMPMAQFRNGLLFFNPGSPTDKIFAPYNSYGILEIENGKLTPNIIKI